MLHHKVKDYLSQSNNLVSDRNQEVLYSEPLENEC